MYRGYVFQVMTKFKINLFQLFMYTEKIIDGSRDDIINKYQIYFYFAEKCEYDFWKNQVDKVCILMIHNKSEVYQLGDVIEQTLVKGNFYCLLQVI